MFRNYPLSFAYESLSMVLSQEVVFIGEDCKLKPLQSHLFYILFIHSESLKIYKIAIKLMPR